MYTSEHDRWLISPFDDFQTEEEIEQEQLESERYEDSDDAYEQWLANKN